MTDAKRSRTRSRPQAATLGAQLARVDWLRLMQRVGVFFRDMRGDDPRDIQHDHESSLEGSQRVRRYAEHMGEHRQAPSGARRKQ